MLDHVFTDAIGALRVKIGHSEFGKAKFQQSVNELLEERKVAPLATDVYFTQFVVQ
jgi:flagellar basal body-associated protein FliL